MAGFQVDMSPLERSSRTIGQSLVNVGQDIGGAIQQSQQNQERGDVEAFMRQAMDGDPVAMKELMVKSPQAAQQVAQYIQQQQAGQQAEQQAGRDTFDAEKLKANQDTIRKLHRIQSLPEDQRGAAYQEIINDPFDDFDETDIAYMDDPKNIEIAANQYGIDQNEIKAMFGAGDDKGFTLGKGEKRFSSTGREIASVTPVTEEVTEPAIIPNEMLEGLSEGLAAKGSAGYTAAGGGKDGMAVFQKIVDKGTEQERRIASPKILKSNFPQASNAEMSQLQGAMDAAKTTSEGLKSAGKVRAEQKRLVKAKGFQNRAIELLTSIIDSEDLGDVTGSIEGAYDFRPFSDDESELIADIEEAGNILTADNLSLMSGVLSESDIKILKNLAGGGLIRTRTEKRFKEDVTKLRDKLASQMVVTTDERAGGGDNIDIQAMQWAKDNPNDPRAAAIMQKLQGK